MQDPLHAAFELAAAVHRGAAEATRQAALRVETELGTGTARELLRLLHLFFGVPKIVQALNACIEVLPPLATQAAQPCDAAQGELNFRKLYADEADRVLNHAYARALLRDGLSLAQTERLAVLCLAATGCWKQWESHVAIAGRQGVTIATMQADCAAAQAWLGAEASKRAQAELTGRKA
jgi:alkylhydroperoxidase/carboxymuconolactone decarboxylase family protein YurZ